MGRQLRLAYGWRGLTIKFCAQSMHNSAAAVARIQNGIYPIRPHAGPILAQTAVPVKGTDTPQQLAARVLVEVCCAFRRVLVNKQSSTSCFQAPATSHLIALRVHASLLQEHKLYPRCVAALCDGRITWRDDGIPVMWHAE